MTQQFFNFLSREHGLTPTEGEMLDIMHQALNAAHESGYINTYNDMRSEADLHKEAKNYYGIIPCVKPGLVPDKGYKDVKIVTKI